MTHEPTGNSLSDALWPPLASMVGIPDQAAYDVALAHALRTPLTVIRGQSQLMRWWANRPGALNLAAVLQAAEKIEEATKELAAAIDNMHLCETLPSSPPQTVTHADGAVGNRGRTSGC